MTVRVFVLKEGTIDREPDGTILDASSSVTLVLSDDKSIVVDTAMPQDAIEPVRRMCKWIVDETCDPEKVFPMWKTPEL